MMFRIRSFSLKDTKSRSISARDWLVMIVFFLSLLVAEERVNAFSSAPSLIRKFGKPTGISTLRQSEQTLFSRTRKQPLCLVTEEDVLEAVETAEKLWAQALEARKTANALSDRAEEEAEAAASSAKEVDTLFQNKSQPISMQQLAQADAAARSNLDAGSMVNRALQASDDADELERLAEEALQKSEEQLEQHLIDFPDSPLAQ